MNDSSDVLDHPIDERARRAAADLRRVASLRTLPDLADRRRSAGVGRTIAIAVGVLVVIIGGLVVISTRDANTEPAGPDDDLHWIIDGLPDGWRPVAVRGPGTGSGEPSGGMPATETIYGTSAAPAGPAMEVQTFEDPNWVRPAQGGASSATDYEEHTVDGVSVVLATNGAGQRTAWSKPGDRWITVLSTGMTDAAVLDAAGHAVLLEDLSVEIAAQHLPDGVTRLASGPSAIVAPAWWSGFYAPGSVPGTIMIDYSDGAGAAQASLAVSRVVGAQFAYLELLHSTGLSQVNVDGLDVWLAPASAPGRTAFAAWQRDGQFFLLTSSADLDLAALATAVHHATRNEWAHQLDTLGSNEATAVTELAAGTVVVDAGQDGVEAPPETDPPVSVSNELRDLRLSWTITGADAHQMTLGASLPDDTRSSVLVTIVGDSVSVASTDLGSLVFDWAPDAPTKLEYQGAGAIAFTHDPSATQLRVRRASGDRYTVELVTLSGESDTKFAVLTLPFNDFVSSDLLDDNGRVLQHFDNGAG